MTRGSRHLRALTRDRIGLAVVLLAPLVAVAALRAPLVNALSYRDPWFYTGHGWDLANHVENFGLFYYGVRFPVTLPIDWSAALLGPVVGYIALRYVILVATGALVYMVMRRFATRPVAAVAVLLVALTPFYLRGILWDYTTFIAIPASICAIALWHLAPAGSGARVTAVGAGALVAVAMFANPISFPVVIALFGVEALQALRDGRRGVRDLVVRLACAVGGAILVFLAGWLAYRVTLGPITPADLVRPTFDFIEANDARSAPFQLPASEWLRSEPRVYAPVMVVLALVVAMRRDLLGRDLPARLAQTAIAYTAVLWLYRWLVTSSVVETWWAYSNAAVTIVLGLGVLAHVWSQREAPAAGGSRAAIAMVGGAIAAGFAIRVLGDDAVSAYDEVRESLPLLLGLLLLTALAALAASLGPPARVAAAGLSALVMMWGLAPAEYLGVASTGEFSPFSGDDELDLYAAADDLMDLVAPRDEPDAHVMLLSDFTGPAMIGWTNMPHVGGALQNPDLPETMTELTPADVALLRHPTTRELVVLAPTRARVDATVPVLRRAGAAPRILDRGTWADGRLHWLHLDVRSAAR